MINIKVVVDNLNTVTVKATKFSKYYAVHYAVDREGKPCGNRWTVTHIPTGFSFCDYAQIKTAEKLAQEFVKSKLTFKNPEKDLRSKAFKKLEKYIELNRIK